LRVAGAKPPAGDELVRERDLLCADSVASGGAEVGVGLNARELGALDEAVEQGCSLGAALLLAAAC